MQLLLRFAVGFRWLKRSYKQTVRESGVSRIVQASGQGFAYFAPANGCVNCR